MSIKSKDGRCFVVFISDTMLSTFYRNTNKKETLFAKIKAQKYDSLLLKKIFAKSIQGVHTERYSCFSKVK